MTPPGATAGPATAAAPSPAPALAPSTAAPAAAASTAAAPSKDAEKSKEAEFDLNDVKLFEAKFAKSVHEKFVLGLDKVGMRPTLILSFVSLLIPLPLLVCAENGYVRVLCQRAPENERYVV